MVWMKRNFTFMENLQPATVREVNASKLHKSRVAWKLNLEDREFIVFFPEAKEHLLKLLQAVVSYFLVCVFFFLCVLGQWVWWPHRGGHARVAWCRETWQRERPQRLQESQRCACCKMVGFIHSGWDSRNKTWPKMTESSHKSSHAKY